MPHGPHLRRPVTVGSHSPQYRIPISGFSTCEEGSYGPQTFSPSTQWSHKGNREGHSALLLRSLWCLASAVRTRCAPDAPITVAVFSTGARRKQCAQGLCWRLGTQRPILAPLPAVTGTLPPTLTPPTSVRPPLPSLPLMSSQSPSSSTKVRDRARGPYTETPKRNSAPCGGLSGSQ